MTHAAVVPSGRVIAFDPTFHLYRVDGRDMISVTQVLRESGLVDFTPSGGGYGVASGVLARKAALGRAVHVASHYFDEGDLDWRTLDPAVAPYLDAYRLMLDETRFRPILCEARLFHPAFQYVGTLDKIGTIDRYPFGVLLDLKTGNPESSCSNLQTAAYLDAYLTAPDPRVKYGDRVPPTFERWTVHLRRDATYRLIKHTDYRDLSVFRAALAVTHYKRKGGH